jgi:PAS domain S-box-containing protein
MVILYFFWSIFPAANTGFCLLFPVDGLLPSIDPQITTLQFFPLLNSSPQFLFLVLVIILIVSFVVFGALMWSFLLRRAVNKKIAELSVKFASTKSDKDTCINEPEEDDVFFSADTINFLRHHRENPLPSKIAKMGIQSGKQGFGSSVNRYREFAQLLPDLVFECDVEGNLVFLNNAASKLLNLDLQRINAERISIFDFLHPDDVSMARENINKIANQQKSKESEYRLVSNNKLLMIVLAYVLPVIEDDKVVGIRGLLVDVSQKRKNEETIKTLQDIVSHVGLGINVYAREDSSDPYSFRLEMVNKASGKLMRFSHEENIGKNLDEISPLLKQKQLHHVFHQVLQSGKYNEIDDFVYQPDPLLPPRFLNLRVFPLPQNRVVLLMEDTTDKKKDEQNLKMTSFGIENAGDIIFWVDENANILFANGTACRKYGYTRDELLGMTLPDVDARISMMQWYELVQILENKPSLVMESINKSIDGDTFPVEISINKFEFGGKKNYFSFVRDISDRKKNDELEQKIQVARKSAAIKQQFLANMSHEIRTPMTGIMGMTSLLMRTNLSPAQIEYVRNIKISSENLLNIINDVLDLSKIEAGKMDLKPNRIDLREFVNEIKEVFLHQARHKGLKFTSSIQPIIPPFIFVDDQRLKQVVNNLLSNAFKFTDEGEISIKFFVVQKVDRELLLRCEVRDTGMGISEENQKQIFEKFTQIDSSLIRPFEGTGLGLAICRELTQLMGGDIKVKSILDKGSTFTFTFKAEFDLDDIEIPEIAGAIEVIDLDINVLHVEDKLLNQKVVGFILFNAGCNVDFVKNGQEAIDSYYPGKYDIILMDIQMPVMDGITAYKELKRLHGDKLCPVIGLSANALEGDAEKYMELGLDDYIVKPFQPHVLYEKIMKWTGKQHS